MERNRTLREGIMAGLIGAAAIALWFLVVDVLAGQPFATPRTLGAALLSVLGPAAVADGSATQVLAYTAFHVVAFILIGLLVATLAQAAEREPTLLFGFFILFVIFEVGWYGLTAMVARPEALGQIAWLQVMAANLVAALAMGAYLWKVHPKLRTAFTPAFQGGR